jgi:hypothetical protein
LQQAEADLGAVGTEDSASAQATLPNLKSLPAMAGFFVASRIKSLSWFKPQLVRIQPHRLPAPAAATPLAAAVAM